jgi:hypothetical protein
MYFDEFAKFLYEFEIKGKPVALRVTDITQNVRIRKELLANVALYDTYDIMEGETPEIIAEKFYGNAQYHWIIMLANEMYDYRTDFPLPYPELQRYIEDIYGNQADDVKHFIDSRGYVVNSDFPGATSVSNRQYEEQQNEKKRRIKIISPNILSTILDSYKELL